MEWQAELILLPKGRDAHRRRQGQIPENRREKQSVGRKQIKEGK